MSRPAVSALAVSQVSLADKWVSRAASATVAALAGLAGALSYSHMQQLAQEHGQAGWHGHVFPLSVDGLEIVASLVLLADHRSGRRPGWLPWAALVTGTAGSLAANVATASPDVISRIIAGWPAFALLIAVKLLSGMLHRPAASTSEPAIPVPDSVADRSGSCRGEERGLPTRTWTTSPSADSRLSATSLRAGIADLLPAARAAADSIRRDGHRLTRDALAARLREAGHPVGNSRLTPLLQLLRNETAATS